MPPRVFLDTGAFLGRYLPSDQHHAAAVAAWERLEREAPHMYTSRLVLSETLTLLARRASHAFAAQRARVLYASSSLTLLTSDRDTDAEALDLFEKYADQRIGFTDCVSFALMRREGLERVFTFDRHFRFAGFEVVPGA